MTDKTVKAGLIDALAQEIRRVDGNHSLGAGQLAEALMPFISALPDAGEPAVKALEWTSSQDGYWFRAESLGLVYEIRNYEVAEYKKGQCQADFEARIRSALVPTTSPAKGGAEGHGRLYDADEPMADGEIEMTAAENVLAWLIIEKIGVPDDRNYSPNEAQEILVRRLDYAKELEDAALRTSAPVGKEQAAPSASDQSEA